MQENLNHPNNLHHKLQRVLWNRRVVCHSHNSPPMVSSSVNKSKPHPKSCALKIYITTPMWVVVNLEASCLEIFLPKCCYHFWFHCVQYALLISYTYIWWPRQFRVCKSVHHHTFKWINQPDAEISQVYWLSFKYSSTCFGHPHAHHQELQQLQ